MLKMTDESLFYDHYKDTFELQKGYLAERNKLTAWMLILLVFVAGFIYDPTMINEKVNTYVKSQVEGFAVELKFLNTGVIFLFLWVMTRYYQVVFQIEKMYLYLKDCEDKLCEDKEYIVNREGAYYLKSYPWYSDVVNACYVVLLPLAIIAVAIVKIVNECSWTTHFKIVDFIGLGLIILLSLLYLSNRLFREEYFDKTQFSGMKWYIRIQHYLRLNKKNA